MTREVIGIERETAKERGRRRIPLSQTGIVSIHARAREELVAPGIAVVEVEVLRIAEEAEVDGDKGLG